jgi:thioredoxin reductase
MRSVDVAVIGAGPAGIGAALAAGSRGVSVVLIDENPHVGGHLSWSIAHQQGAVGDLSDARGVDIARWADERLRESVVDVMRGAVAWGLFDGNILGATLGERSFQLQAQSVIVATGSTALVVPFPGWEIPGVMTSTAALKLLHIHRVLPGRDVVVVGDGECADEVIEALEAAGAAVIARAASEVGVTGGGDTGIEWVEIHGRRRAADCVVIAAGRQPDPQLAVQLQAVTGYSERDGCFVPLRSVNLETSVPGVFAVGDCAGTCTSAESFAEGTVAGVAASGGDGLERALSALDGLRSPARADQVKLLALPVAVRT